jgi:hypothetical protein
MCLVTPLWTLKRENVALGVEVERLKESVAEKTVVAKELGDVKSQLADTQSSLSRLPQVLVEMLVGLKGEIQMVDRSVGPDGITTEEKA